MIFHYYSVVYHLPLNPVSEEEVNTLWTSTPIPSYDSLLNDTQAAVNSTEMGRDIWSDSAATGLIAALCFGIIFFTTVVVLVGKRCYDGWQRRHYTKIDYLINGMYN